jgi:collagen type III alpha
MDKGGQASGAAGSSGGGGGTYIPPVPTRAALGHAIGAQKYLAPHHTGEEWKMSKFKTVGSKVGKGATWEDTAAWVGNQAFLASFAASTQPP